MQFIVILIIIYKGIIAFLVIIIGYLDTLLSAKYVLQLWIITQPIPIVGAKKFDDKSYSITC